ncbi:MAG: hypothetical protein ACK56F_18260 [bacterium]|jgi:hypothetical protein
MKRDVNDKPKKEERKKEKKRHPFFLSSARRRDPAIPQAEGDSPKWVLVNEKEGAQKKKKKTEDHFARC